VASPSSIAPRHASPPVTRLSRPRLVGPAAAEARVGPGPHCFGEYAPSPGLGEGGKHPRFETPTGREKKGGRGRKYCMSRTTIDPESDRDIGHFKSFSKLLCVVKVRIAKVVFTHTCTRKFFFIVFTFIEDKKILSVGF